MAAIVDFTATDMGRADRTFALARAGRGGVLAASPNEPLVHRLGGHPGALSHRRPNRQNVIPKRGSI